MSQRDAEMLARALVADVGAPWSSEGVLARALLVAVEALHEYAKRDNWRGMGTVDWNLAQEALAEIRGE